MCIVPTTFLVAKAQLCDDMVSSYQIPCFVHILAHSPTSGEKCTVKPENRKVKTVKQPFKTTSVFTYLVPFLP